MYSVGKRDQVAASSYPRPRSSFEKAARGAWSQCQESTSLEIPSPSITVETLQRPRRPGGLLETSQPASPSGDGFGVSGAVEIQAESCRVEGVTCIGATGNTSRVPRSHGRRPSWGDSVGGPRNAQSTIFFHADDLRGRIHVLCPRLRRLLSLRRRHRSAWPDHQHATGALHAIQLETSWPRSRPHPSLASAHCYGELERSQHRPAFPSHRSEPSTSSTTATLRHWISTEANAPRFSWS